jgi:hypothetical protein
VTLTRLASPEPEPPARAHNHAHVQIVEEVEAAAGAVQTAITWLTAAARAADQPIPPAALEVHRWARALRHEARLDRLIIAGRGGRSRSHGSHGSHRGSGTRGGGRARQVCTAPLPTASRSRRRPGVG